MKGIKPAAKMDVSHFLKVLLNSKKKKDHAAFMEKYR